MVRHRKSRKTSRKKKTDVIELRTRKGAKENENIKFKKGGLHKSLKFSGTFTKAEMARLGKKKIGQKFTFKGNKFVMTDKLKDQVTLAKTMMSWNKKASRKPKKASRKPSRKTSRKPKKASRKPKKASRKPKKASRKPKKASRKPKKASRKPKKASRKPKKASRKPKKASRKPKKASRKPKKVNRKPKKASRKPSHKTSSKLKKTVPAANKKVKAGTYLRKILDILRSENRWFIYDSYQNSYPNQKWEKEKAYRVLDIGDSCYVVGALKRGIKLGLIEKRERPGEKKLYMGHVYRAVWDDAPVKKKKSPNKKQPKKTKKYKIGDVKSKLKSVFFVLGAPNKDIKKQLNDFYDQNNENMKIVFCSDYYTMVDTERAKDEYPSGKKKKTQDPIAKDIHGIPTNCRAHAEPGDEETHTDEKIKNFRTEQEATSNALVDMFNFSREKNVPLYLASIPRDIRPLNVSKDENPTPLTQEILESIVYPSYANKNDIPGKKTFEEQLKEHSKYNASFLIDLITVVMAMLLDIVWSKKTVKVSTGTGIYKSHEFGGKPVTLWKNKIENVKYFKMEEHEGKDAITVYIFDFNDENMQRLNGKLNQVADDVAKKILHSKTIQPCFENSFVFGDDLLNDVDDIPARYVVSFYTQNNVENYINYDCGDICSSFL